MKKINVLKIRMRATIAVWVGLALSVPVVAEPFVEGRVRLASGQPAVAAQVLLFDLTDLRRGPVARATTDAVGHFALASLGGPALPPGFALGQNYPNPFNPATIIPYQLPATAQVRLEVFNVLGQRVATLVDEERPAGFHAVAWDATNAAGQAVAAGVYMYRLTAGGEQQTRGHTWGVRAVSFSADGSLLASGSGDGTILLWQLASIASH